MMGDVLIDAGRNEVGGGKMTVSKAMATNRELQAAMTIQCVTCKAVFQGTSKQLV